MSYNNPSSQRSPWFYVGIGCASLFAVGFVGCIGVGIWAVNTAKEVGKDMEREAKTPLTKQQLITEFKDVPFYPGANVETDDTFRRLRSGIRIMKRMKLFHDVNVAMLTTTDPADKIASFYEKKMPANGYTEGNRSTKQGDSDEMTSLEYRKGNDMAIIQIRKPNNDDTPKHTTVTILRFEGVKQGWTYPGSR